MLLAKVYHDAHWEPGIGDPSFMGWFIVGCYLLAAVLCLACGLRRRRLIDAPRSRRLGLFWFGLGAVMLVLAVNKQLDLQSLVHVTGRNVAIKQGWFDQRRVVQRWFLVGVGVAGVLSVLVMLWLMRGLWARVWLSLVGVAVLVCFIVMRAASFHAFDQVLRQQLYGRLHVNAAFELSGIALIAIGAMFGLSSRKTPTNPASHAAR